MAKKKTAAPKRARNTSPLCIGNTDDPTFSAKGGNMDFEMAARVRTFRGSALGGIND